MSMSRFIGKTFGNYRVEAPIDAGAMGYVYSGKHIYLNREAAIKIMREKADDAGYRSRFLEETRSAAGIKNVNVAEIYEFGEQDDQLYTVMELVPDGSLRTLLQQRAKKPWSLALGIDLIRQAAEGLAAAHAQRIVHSDIKPENLLLWHLNPEEEEAEYQLKISDFGLARIEGGNAVTSLGAPTGTFTYMSPEQCKGIKIDGRSDIYSLGVVLYEVATGYLPFQINTFDDALRKHVEVEPTPPSQLRSSITPELEAIILRCLAKKPEDRYQTGTALARALESLQFERRKKKQVQVEVPQEKEPPKKEPRRRIELSLEPENITITPGQATSIRVILTNPGSDVDWVSLSMEGAPLEWITRPNEIQLKPGEKETINLYINVPRTPNNLARDYVFKIRAHSRQQASEQGFAQMLWKVLPFSNETLRIDPPRMIARDGAKYTVSVSNEGNIAAYHTFSGEDDNSTLSYQFNQPEVTLAPGQKADIPLLVRGRARFIGSKQSRQFRVYSRKNTPAHSLVANAEFVSKPLLSPAITAIIGVVSVVLVVGVVLGSLFLINSHNSSSSSHVTVIFSGKLQVQATSPDTIHANFAPNLSVTNFKLVANVTVQGDEGGIIFRSNSNASQGYRFLVAIDGTYSLTSQRGTLVHKSSSSIQTGSGSTNQITVEAQGNHITISINSHTEVDIQDTSATSGAIGVLAADLQQPTITAGDLTVSQ